MRSNWTNRSFLILLAVAFLGITASAFAQRSPSTPGGGATGSSGAPGSPTRGTTGTTPGLGTGTGAIGTNPRTIFLSGKVMLDDGTPPNPNIRIERVCGGIPRLETHTDNKGHFSFQVGQNLSVDTDAADPSGTSQNNGQWSSSSNSNSGLNGGNNRMDPLWNCELRAAYPGYRSDVVDLATRHSLDDPDLGTIVLHHLGNVQGSTISMTTALAPKHAQKDYEKGLQLAQKGDWENAEKRLTAATTAYPKYAIAWAALGQVEAMQNRNEEAAKAYQAAIAADSKYVTPYDALAALAVRQAKWQDALDYSKQAIDLNPVEFPRAFWSNALANYQLKKPDAAEKSVRSLLKIDTVHQFPQAENLLAHLLAQKGNYPEAAEHLRTYLALVPNAKDAATVREDLAKLEQASTQEKK